MRAHTDVKPVQYGTSISGYSLKYRVDSNELWFSKGHYRRPNGAWSGGGPLLVRHFKQELGTEETHTDMAFGSSYTWKPLGTSLLAAPAPSSSSLAYSLTGATGERDTAKPYYATGYARTRPGRPEAGLGQFLIELRDLPKLPFKGLMGTLKGAPFATWPSHISRGVLNFRALGDNYLNVEFGWKPFVKDLIDVYTLMKSIDRQMGQIIRDNGRSVRRKTTILESNTSSILSQGGNNQPYWLVQGGPVYTFGGGASSWMKTQTQYEKVWFAAAYRYYIPNVSSWGWDARARAALFGVLPTPALLWEVLPWSWLVDWFSNVGDVVSNASLNAVDNLVTLYSYVMRETRVVTHAYVDTARGSFQTYLSGSPYHRGEAVGGRYETKVTTHIKRRVAGGSPYGLDVQWTDLTGRQLAILAALGITRG